MFGKQRKRLDDAETRLDSIASQLVRLETRMAEIEGAELQREDLYEKMRTLYARLNKRTQRAEELESPAQAAPLNPAAIRLLNPYGNHG